MKFYFAVIIFLLFCSQAWASDVVTNGSFEMKPITSERPPYWYAGWSDSPASFANNGSWALDASHRTDGAQSLRISPASNDGYLLTQILHIPTHNLKGKEVEVWVDMRKKGLKESPYLLVFALNPTLHPDPQFNIGLAGKTLINADSPDNQWQSYTGSFTATDNALCLAVALHATGRTGSVWFDNIRIEVNSKEVLRPMKTKSNKKPVLEERAFRLGFVGESPIDYSEKAQEKMVEEIASSAEAINIFFHVRWMSLTGEQLRRGHRHQLQQAEIARGAGLELAMTFDFTHNSPEEVGHINPQPKDIPRPQVEPFNLTNPTVRNAYMEELFALVAIVKPQWVIVGIEMDSFHDKHPDQWDEYVAMYKDIYKSLKVKYSDVKVGAYFTLSWMISPSATLNSAHAAKWRMLLPELDFIGYSAYPGTAFYPAKKLAKGYFTKAREVASDLPLLIPEFGILEGKAAKLDEEKQAAFLERIFNELSRADIELVCWHSLYDQSYIATPKWFQNAFSRLGMYNQNGMVKKVWAVWNTAYRAKSPFHHRP